MLSASSTQRPPGPSLVATTSQGLAPSFSFHMTMPLYVPREQKYTLFLESICTPSVLPQLLSLAINSAVMVSMAGGAISDLTLVGAGCEHPAKNSVVTVRMTV